MVQRTLVPLLRDCRFPSWCRGMESTKVRVGIVGSRFQADCIAAAVKAVPEEAELVAVASPTDTTLGRPFSNGQTVTFLNIVQPGALYGDRLNDLDLRFGKILKYSRSRTLVAVDLFNVFNSNTPDVYSTFPYGTTYLNPTNITAARFANCARACAN